jgi:hypothetical protein
LSLDGVLSGPEKRPDPQMLLDPFKEEFHLPAQFINHRNGECGLVEIIAEKGRSFAGLRVHIGHAPQGIRIDLYGFNGGKNGRLIGAEARCLIHGPGVAALK